MELNDYLLFTLTQTNSQVTFSGDRPGIINKFLVKGVLRKESNLSSVEPDVNNGICYTLPDSVEGLSPEELESNWRFYGINTPDQKPNEIFTTDTDQYVYSLSCIYCEAERDAVIDIWNINPIRIWINGRLVMTTSISYNTRYVMFAFRFKKGLNTILIERPRYTANHKKMGIMDLVSNIALMPVEFLTSKEYIELFDEGLFEELKSSYIILPEKSLFKDRKVSFVVLPKWFDTPNKEKVQIEVRNSCGELLNSFEAFTGEQIQPGLDENVNGVLILKALGLENGKQSYETYIFCGNFVKERNLLIKKAELILGTENNIIKSIKRLVKIPDLCNELGEMLQEELYDRMLKQYSEFENALMKADDVINKSSAEIFDSNFMTCYESEIDDGYLSYGINLPRNYSREKAYPLVLLWQWGYAFSAIYRTTRYVRRTEFDEAIIVTMSARGDISSDYINEINILNIINSVVKEYKIDMDSITVVGHCSSATMAFALAVRKPDLFSGIGNIAGFPKDEDIHCIENIKNLNLYNLFGFDDLNNIAVVANIQHSNLFKEVKNYFYNFYGHPEVNEFFNSRGLIKALLKGKRERYPKKLCFIPKAPMYNKSYWLSIDSIEDIMNNARIEAEIIQENKLIISTENIKRFTLLLGQKEMNLNKNLEILLNNISYMVEIPDYSAFAFEVQSGGIEIKQKELEYREFQRLYDLIAVKEELLGLKQVYLKKCIILKSDNINNLEEDNRKLLFDILQNPLKSRVRNYKYEIIDESIVEDSQISESNFVMYIDPMDKSSLKGKVIESSGIALEQNKIVYNNEEFYGRYFAAIKVENPFNADKFAIMIINNSKDLGDELISFLKTFANNPLFFCDAVIYNNGEYRSFRPSL